MPIELKPFFPEAAPAIREFNKRLLAGGIGSEFLLPETFDRPDESAPVYSDWTLAIENSDLRGSYQIQWRNFWIGNEARLAGDYYAPISEGAWNHKYGLVGAMLLKHALRRCPLLYTVGMGGLDRPLPKMLKSLRWELALVPFLFRVLNASRFLRELQFVRTTVARRLALDSLALTGLGSIGVHGLQAWKSLGGPSTVRFESEPCAKFEAWADELWDRYSSHYSFAGVRTADHLNALYSNSRFLRLQLSRAGKPAGWVVVMRKKQTGNKYFGDMTTGVLVDAWCDPAEAAAAVNAALDALRRAGVDMVICNTPHMAWLAALRSNGFLSGPSNYGFAVSPEIAKHLGPWESALMNRVHLMRGDGDGLSNFY